MLQCPPTQRAQGPAPARGAGRAAQGGWEGPRPDPISKGSASRPFVRVCVRERGGRGFKARLAECALEKTQSHMGLEWLRVEPSPQPLLCAPRPCSPEGHLRFHSKSSRAKAEIKMNPWRGTLV